MKKRLVQPRSITTSASASRAQQHKPDFNATSTNNNGKGASNRLRHIQACIERSPRTLTQRRIIETLNGKRAAHDKVYGTNAISANDRQPETVALQSSAENAPTKLTASTLQCSFGADARKMLGLLRGIPRTHEDVGSGNTTPNSSTASAERDAAQINRSVPLKLMPYPRKVRTLTNEALPLLRGKPERKELIAKHLVQQALAKDLYIPSPKVTPYALQQWAISFGYPQEYAYRLAFNSPFTLNDVRERTVLNDESSEKNAGWRSEIEARSMTHIEFKHAISLKNTNDHQLYFRNSFLPGSWTMAVNMRNPVLADFFADEVAGMQAQLVEQHRATLIANAKNDQTSERDKDDNPEQEISEIIRENVVSVSGKNWVTNNRIRPGDLSPDDLSSFLKTENGKSSERIALGMEKKIVSARAVQGSMGLSIHLKLDNIAPTAKAANNRRQD